MELKKILAEIEADFQGRHIQVYAAALGRAVQLQLPRRRHPPAH